MKKSKNKENKGIVNKLKKSPINYFSDLFIIAMVLMWIVDNVYQSVIATIVTLSSVKLSIDTGAMLFDTSMWSSIGTNVAIPLSCGGAIWMVKNSVQHAIAYTKGKRAHEDFPAVDGASNYDMRSEEPMMFEDSSDTNIQTEEIINDQSSNDIFNENIGKG